MAASAKSRPCRRATLAEVLFVYGPDFGHNDPQWLLPYVGQMTVADPVRRITVQY